MELSLSTVPEFYRRFPAPDFDVSEEAVKDAVVRRSQFNINHPASGLKIDVIIPDISPFNRSRFDRARKVQAGEDWDASFATPEDVIIKKLEYYKESRSEKHLRDIAGVIKTSRNEVDLVYIEGWVKDFGLADEWQTVRKRLWIDD